MNAVTAPTKTVDVAGTAFAYREVGTGQGVPLVLLHHVTAVLDDWDPAVVDGLAAERHVIMVDLRGVGRSGGTTPDNFEAMSDDTIAFLDALGLDVVDLLGYSLGRRGPARSRRPHIGRGGTTRASFAVRHRLRSGCGVSAGWCGACPRPRSAAAARHVASPTPPPPTPRA
jgi:pimeloyl-ACP methyl ester carboxylesterase